MSSSDNSVGGHTWNLLTKTKRASLTFVVSHQTKKMLKLRALDSRLAGLFFACSGVCKD